MLKNKKQIVKCVIGTGLIIGGIMSMGISNNNLNECTEQINNLNTDRQELMEIVGKSDTLRAQRQSEVDEIYSRYRSGEISAKEFNSGVNALYSNEYVETMADDILDSAQLEELDRIEENIDSLEIKNDLYSGAVLLGTVVSAAGIGLLVGEATKSKEEMGE